MTTFSGTATPNANVNTALSSARTALTNTGANLCARAIQWRTTHPSRRTVRKQLADAQLAATIYRVGFEEACRQADKFEGALACLAQSITATTDEYPGLTEAQARKVLHGTHPQRAIAAGALLEVR